MPSLGNRTAAMYFHVTHESTQQHVYMLAKVECFFPAFHALVPLLRLLSFLELKEYNQSLEYTMLLEGHGIYL